MLDDPCRVNDRAFRAAFARYKFPINGRLSFSAPPTTIGQLIPENESAACLSNGASCLRVRVSRKKKFFFGSIMELSLDAFMRSISQSIG